MMQEHFGPGPFASDLLWDALGATAGLHWLLSPVRKRVQRLAQKYRHRPKIFRDKFLEIIKRRIQSANASPEGKASLEAKAYYDQRVNQHREAINPLRFHSRGDTVEHPLGSTLGLSRRKLEAIKYLIPLLSALFAGRPVKVPPKKLRARILSLFSLQPGNPPSGETIKIRTIDSEAHAEGRHLTDGQIAAKAFTWYRGNKARRKAQTRQLVKDARLPCSCKSIS
jgi:hypothetical protein